MKATKKVIVPAVPAKEVEREIAIICDVCRAQSPDDDGWEEETYGFSEVKVSHSHGSRWPNGEGFSESVSFDLCPKCFHEKLLPFLESLGAVATKEERDW